MPGLAAIEWDIVLDVIGFVMAFGVGHTSCVRIDTSETILVDASACNAIGRSQFVCCDNDSPFSSGQLGETG